MSVVCFETKCKPIHLSQQARLIVASWYKLLIVEYFKFVGKKVNEEKHPDWVPSVFPGRKNTFDKENAPSTSSANSVNEHQRFARLERAKKSNTSRTKFCK